MVSRVNVVEWARTRVVSADRSFHDGLHPLTDGGLFVVTEKVRLVCLMDDPESITARVDVLVRNDLVPYDIDISLDLRFLHRARERQYLAPQIDSPPCCCSVECTNVVP